MLMADIAPKTANRVLDRAIARFDALHRPTWEPFGNAFPLSGGYAVQVCEVPGGRETDRTLRVFDRHGHLVGCAAV